MFMCLNGQLIFACMQLVFVQQAQTLAGKRTADSAQEKPHSAFYVFPVKRNITLDMKKN